MRWKSKKKIKKCKINENKKKHEQGGGGIR